MQLIRCTAKLLKELGLKPADLQHESPSFSFLGPWHANLIFVNRRKCVLFVNDRTLFNFIVADVSREYIRRIREMFRDNLACVLSEESVPPDVCTRILAEYEEIDIGKSSGRSVLGSANDLAYHYKFSIMKAGGVHSWKLPEIIKQLNRMPMHASTPKSMYPIEELGKLYGFAV